MIEMALISAGVIAVTVLVALAWHYMYHLMDDLSDDKPEDWWL